MRSMEREKRERSGNGFERRPCTSRDGEKRWKVATPPEDLIAATLSTCGGAQTALAGSHMMRTCERLDANERRRERPCARGGARLAARACASRRGCLGAPWHCARARGRAHIGVEATRESRRVASANVRSNRQARRVEAHAKRGAAAHCPMDRMTTLAKRMPKSRASSVQKWATKLQIDLQR